MRIGITADLHLSPDHPEREESFSTLLQILSSRGIEELIVAGDSFDQERYTYGDLDRIARRFPHIRFYSIPGNHDGNLRKEHFSSPNIKVYSEPEWVEIGGVPFLFLPYKDGITMDEAIDQVARRGDKKFFNGKWVLIGHGEFLSSRTIGGRLEGGEGRKIYMPLSPQLIGRYRPASVFLGHTHTPFEVEEKKVYSPGSPCPVAEDEVGRRSFLLCDLSSFRVERIPISPPALLYMKEELVFYPGGEEVIERELLERIKGWGFREEEIRRTVLLIKGVGSVDRKDRVEKRVQDLLSSSGFLLKEIRVDLDGLYVPGQDLPSRERIAIFKECLKKVSSLPSLVSEVPLKKEKVVQKIARMIFGEGR